jgi:hypothetical protein
MSRLRQRMNLRAELAFKLAGAHQPQGHDFGKQGFGLGLRREQLSRCRVHQFNA